MFQFRLDTILRYRTQIEDGEKRELGKIYSELAVETNKKDKCIGDAKQSGLDLDEKKATGNFSSGDFFLYDNFIEGMKRRVGRQNRVITQIEERVEKQREKLVEAMRKRQIFSTLKSHKYQEYIVEENRSEQKFLDEIVATRRKQEEA